METSMKGFEPLEIQLEAIKSATNNFSEENVIGHGGFGKVYKGELSHSHSEGKSMVALKRLDRRQGQGDAEFYKEVRMLSCYRHENIISLLGFSSGRDEMILVYEYASRGSLDGHLKDVNLTWTQRLKICLDAAKGLCYLHDPRETYQRLIHCDIKSANILLDENFNAKVSDFGLSKIGPVNQQNSILVTDALGTFGYCDPLFMETYTLTKESDVYSFGVVLFEVLSGRLCSEFSNGQLKILVPLWKKSYEENKLNEIIMQDLMQQMDPSSWKTFSDIAFQCLRKARKERPTMSRVVEELEIALESQEFPDLRLELLTKYEDILMAADPLLIYKTGNQLKELLSKGLIVNEGKTWFSINDKEEHCLMLSIEDCLIHDDPNRDYSDEYSLEKNSRFTVGCYFTKSMNFKMRVRTPLFLSPYIRYRLNLVFKHSKIREMKQQSFFFWYKLQGEAKMSTVHLADQIEDEWLVAELYQFISNAGKRILDLEIIFEKCGFPGDFYIDGIEFQPLGRVEHAVAVVDYEEILKGAVTPVFYTSVEELKSLLTRGIILNGCKTLSITEKGEHIERICIEACLNLDEIEARYLQHPSGDIVNSRFPGGLCYEYWGRFKARVRGEYLTPQISYTLNLVFRYGYEYHVNSYSTLRYKIDGVAKVFIIYPSYMREDGWFIAPLYHFTSQHTTADLQFEFEDRAIILILVAGIEFQPSEEKVQLPEE